MRKTLLVLLALVLSLAITPSVIADTLTFTGTSGVVDPSGSAYVFPYQLSLNGAPSVNMMCFSYTDEITQGETWDVTTSVPTGTLQLEAAWLLQDIVLHPSNSEVDQLAAWYAANNSAIPSVDMTTLLNGVSAITQYNAAVAGIDNGFNASNFVIYIPTSNENGWTEGEPQPFVSISNTPEPNSLLLLGSGLFGLAFLLKRNWNCKPSH
jgi:hypothetical protein